MLFCGLQIKCTHTLQGRKDWIRIRRVLRAMFSYRSCISATPLDSDYRWQTILAWQCRTCDGVIKQRMWTHHSVVRTLVINDCDVDPCAPTCIACDVPCISTDIYCAGWFIGCHQMQDIIAGVAKPDTEFDCETDIEARESAIGWSGVSGHTLRYNPGRSRSVSRSPLRSHSGSSGTRVYGRKIPRSGTTSGPAYGC